MNQFNILTIYPDFFESFNKHGLITKGLDKEIIQIKIIINLNTKIQKINQTISYHY